MGGEAEVKPSAEEVLRQVVEKITPAILEMYARQDNGEIRIQFKAGEFQRARKEVAL